MASSLACLLLVAPVGSSQKLRDKNTASKIHDPRPVTVADAIEMTQFGDLGYIRGVSAKYDAPRFSPDGAHFVIVTSKGNIKTNTNDYSLLLFTTDSALQSPRPEILVSMSSSSNFPGIEDIKWVDNRTVAFRGQNPGELPQVYEVDSETRQLTKLTNASTGVTAYAFGPGGDSFFFLSPRPTDFAEGKDKRSAVVVSNQLLLDLVASEDQQDWSNSFRILTLFRKWKKGDQEVSMRTLGGIVRWSPLWLSSNGRHLIVITVAVDYPDSWKDYDDFWLQSWIRSGTTNFIRHYELIDIASGQPRILLDAPANYSACGPSAITWSPDSKSVVVAGNFLPLSVSEPAERKLRQSKKMIAEIKVPSLEIVPITSREVCPLRWDSGSGKLLTGLTRYFTQMFSYQEELVAFQKGAVGWEEVEFPKSGLAQNRRIAVTLEEDMNSPPKLLVRDIQTGQKSLLLDFNPQFKDLKFGRVEDITFEATDGHKVRGGLYFPIDYIQGKRYPLVIQTHGWDPQRFRIDGEYSSASAAQPLAGRGFVVLQLDERSTAGTPEEYRAKASAYEGAIDYFDRLGVIARDRVGIIGFSRTGLGVEYALTHSKYHFAAATLADHSDGGYFAYLSSLPGRALEFETINGGLPFGDGLTAWMKASPGFNLIKVTTPVREEAYSPGALLWAWEWYTGLSRLGRPVELVYMPDAGHVLVKPRDRMASQQGTVDWFSFWLQDYEDPDPTKAEQYKRWRELRKLKQEPTRANQPH